MNGKGDRNSKQRFARRDTVTAHYRSGTSLRFLAGFVLKG
jgi:hypothetical protein